MSFNFVHFKCSFRNKILVHCCLNNTHHSYVWQEQQFYCWFHSSILQSNIPRLMFAISGYLPTDLCFLNITHLSCHSFIHFGFRILGVAHIRWVFYHWGVSQDWQTLSSGAKNLKQVNQRGGIVGYVHVLCGQLRTSRLLLRGLPRTAWISAVLWAWSLRPHIC